MTDNEIIKALVCCVHRTCNECIRQPIEYGRTERDCKSGLMKSALDLINRQKAEIENLSIALETTRNNLADTRQELNNAETEIERLKNTGIIGGLCPMWKAEARTEAIKEFAERVKDEYSEGFFVSTEFLLRIDNLVKEMVGDVG